MRTTLHYRTPSTRHSCRTLHSSHALFIVRTLCCQDDTLKLPTETYLEKWEEEEDLLWCDGRTVRVGSQPDSELRVPLFCSEGKRSAAPLVACFAVRSNVPVVQARAPASVYVGETELSDGDECELYADDSGSPSIVWVGDFFIFVVRRRGRLALRMRQLVPGVVPAIAVDE